MRSRPVVGFPTWISIVPTCDAEGRKFSICSSSPYTYRVQRYWFIFTEILLFDTVSSENILPSGSKRQSRAPRKFSTSAYDPPKPAPKEESYIPEAVRKMDIMNGHIVFEIKWKGLSESQNTWAPREQVRAHTKKHNTFRSREMLSMLTCMRDKVWGTKSEESSR